MYAHCIRVFRLSVICDYTLSAILQMMCYITNSAILQMMLEHLIAVLSWVEIEAMCLQRSRCLFTVLYDAALIARLYVSGVGAAVLIAMLCYARYCSELTARKLRRHRWLGEAAWLGCWLEY